MIRISLPLPQSYLDIRLRVLEVVLIPAPRHYRDVVGVVLGDDAPGEQHRHAQLVLKPETENNYVSQLYINHKSTIIVTNCSIISRYVIFNYSKRL